MTLRDNGKYEIEEEEDDESMPPLKDIEDEESLVHRELLAVRKALNLRVRGDE